MYKYIFIVSLFCFVISCKSDPAAVDADAYAAQKESLANKEKRKPLAFLRLKSDCKKNWIGQTVVSGTITNVATVCSYKEVRLKMLCYDKSSKMVEEHEDIMDVIINPNTSKDFRLRYRLPRGADSVSLNIMSAAVNE